MGTTATPAHIVVTNNNHIVKRGIIAEFAGQDVAAGIQIVPRYSRAILHAARRRLVTYHARQLERTAVLPVHVHLRGHHCNHRQ
ncbi:hypothetical protein AYI69_g10068 [Smittium culicis]|uniref:Uncharacterized protein n=1 Tax=Smittium culicis TaxID=133412 RepID=A0A1R1X8D3_9FUNG|nr:hypothetical protein AYI69_g10068 [Smittium culicis]